MELAARIGTMARRGEPLPYDAEVEWIGFRGSQYIVIPTGTRGKLCEGRIAWQKLDTPQWFIASRSGSTDWCGMVGLTGSGEWRCFFANSSNRIAGAATNEMTNFVSYNAVWDQRLNVDGVGSATFGTGIALSNYGIWIGCLNVSGFPSLASGFSNCNLENLTIKSYPGNDLLFKLKCVKKNGVAFLYDELSGQLFGNSGTGTLAIGPEKAPVLSASRGGGGTKCLTPRRSYRRSSRPSARFCAHSQEWEVAA